jgi:hypothetical protein
MAKSRKVREKMMILLVGIPTILKIIMESVHKETPAGADKRKRLTCSIFPLNNSKALYPKRII